jgi:hypothetical protein
MLADQERFLRAIWSYIEYVFFPPLTPDQWQMVTILMTALVVGWMIRGA